MKDLVTQMMLRYPTMCGNNVLNALDHLLVCNGTGVDWREDGTTVEYTYDQREDPNPEKREKMHKQAFDLLRTMPDFEPVTIPESYPGHHGGWRQALIDPEQERQLADWDLYHVTKDNARGKLLERIKSDTNIDYYEQRYLERVCKRPSFYTLSLDRYSNVSQLDERADDFTVQACYDVLTAILTAPQGDGHHVQSNHLHALIILLQKRPLFERISCWPGDEDILNHRKVVGKRRLALSCKEHVHNHKIDESRLTDAEYFWYHSLTKDGLTAEEIKLVRKYSFYLRWKEGWQTKQNEDGKILDFKRKREFWKTLKFKRNDGGSVTIEEQTIPSGLASTHVCFSAGIYCR